MPINIAITLVSAGLSQATSVVDNAANAFASTHALSNAQEDSTTADVHFGALLANKQVAKDSESSVSNQAPANDNKNNDNSAGKPSISINALAALLFPQLPVSGKEPGGSATLSVTASSVTTSSVTVLPGNDEVLPLLFPCLVPSLPSSGAGENTGQKATNGTGAALTQAIAVIEVLLQKQNTLSAPDSTSEEAFSAPAKDSANLLAKLNQLLQQQNAQGANAANIPGANAKNTGNEKFAALLTSLLQNTSTVKLPTDITTTLSQIVAALPAVNTGNNDANTGGKDNSNSGNENNSSTSSAQAAQAVGAHPSANPAPSSDFVKLLSSASSGSLSPADQVVVQMRSAVNSGASQIKIQLDPADLGKVEVQMVTGADGKTGITVTADNRQTLAMLQNEARSLESALRDIGLKTDMGGLNFNLRGDQQNQQNFSGKQAGYTQVAAIGEDDDTPSVVTGVYRLSAAQGLDIRV